MEKRYQVFVSSTFRDLQIERQAALRAVLELGHMPAGMELFPASEDSAWELIKDVIDSSDYYVLIIGGRYGSLDAEGLGFTEKEYDYAVKTKKPVIPLLHGEPDNLPRKKTETDEDSWKRLQEFRAKVEASHTCSYWVTPEDLKSKLILGLTAAQKRYPGVGWIRASEVPSGADLADALALRKRVEELEEQLESQRRGPPPGTEKLMQGDDEILVEFGFTARKTVGYENDDLNYSYGIEPTWDSIFGAVAPGLINEAPDASLRSSIRGYFRGVAQDELADNKDLADRRLLDFRFAEDDIDTCLVQLRALGLIVESNKKRSLHDKQTYWTLTPYGDEQMVRLRALHREPAEKDVQVERRVPKQAGD